MLSNTSMKFLGVQLLKKGFLFEEVLHNFYVFKLYFALWFTALCIMYLKL